MIKTGALVLGVAVLVSGCTTIPTAPASVGRVVVAGQARLDTAANIAVLPLDKYSGPQDGVIGYAERIAEKKCMAALGFDYQISTSQVVDNPVGWRIFGLWNSNQATQYGYGIAPDPNASGFNSLNPNMSAKMLAADQSCAQKSVVQFQGTSSSSSTSAYNLGVGPYQSTLSSPAGKRLIAQWQKCMTDKGITVNSNGSGPLSADVDTATVALEQQIKIAVQEVQCKTQGNNIIQQLADIDASFQVVVIKKNQAVLNKMLIDANAQHKIAQAYISQNG